MKEPQSLAEILAILRPQKHVLHTQFGVLDLAVFGSYANSQQNSMSDVDFFADLKPEYKTFDNYNENYTKTALDRWHFFNSLSRFHLSASPWS